MLSFYYLRIYLLVNSVIYLGFFVYLFIYLFIFYIIIISFELRLLHFVSFNCAVFKFKFRRRLTVSGDKNRTSSAALFYLLPTFIISPPSSPSLFVSIPEAFIHILLMNYQPRQTGFVSFLFRIKIMRNWVCFLSFFYCIINVIHTRIPPFAKSYPRPSLFCTNGAI